ncbi:PREDICTED: protein FAM13A-like, partial [Galeopterus variegatus]|uniref:Protein FAM13A-like n=1 Tax=Galeopterus variegatus TaxID=482537 RepID=A0ABM0RSH0_GALVR
CLAVPVVAATAVVAVAATTHLAAVSTTAAHTATVSAVAVELPVPAAVVLAAIIAFLVSAVSLVRAGLPHGGGSGTSGFTCLCHIYGFHRNSVVSSWGQQWHQQLQLPPSHLWFPWRFPWWQQGYFIAVAAASAAADVSLAPAVSLVAVGLTCSGGCSCSCLPHACGVCTCSDGPPAVLLLCRELLCDGQWFWDQAVAPVTVVAGHVPSGLEGMKEQDLCNKIMAKILENYNTLFEVECTENDNQRCENLARLIIVKEASCKNSLPILLTKGLERDMLKPSPKAKIPKSRSEGSIQVHRVPQPELSDDIPQVSLRLSRRKPCLEDMNSAEDTRGAKLISSSQEDERPMSPFYLSAHVSRVSNVSTTTGELLERTIRSAVEQHLFDVNSSGGQSSEDSESGTSSAPSATSTRQQRCLSKEQHEVRRGRDKGLINKENIPSGFNSLNDCILNTQEMEKLHENTSDYTGERSKLKRQKSSTKLSELTGNQDGLVNMEGLNSTQSHERTGPDDVELMSSERRGRIKSGASQQHYQSPTMKIQEHPSISDTKQQRNQDANDQQESFVSEVPQLDLTALCDEKSWEEPIPTFSSWQRENVDSDEARLSPQAGRLIRQLLDEDSDPMLSPRFYTYGQGRQYLDDTEVPPSPPNSHSFMRRRSSSLGSYDDEQEDLTPAQLTRRIQSLKKKIRKFEDRFEEERKYRPSHSDKAANPEVLKWTNDLAKFRKQLKESKLKLSEEDLAPRMRQRSNTLPKSFGSQLEKEDDKKQELGDKALKPGVEATLESIQRRLQEKRAETSRPEDIKDMTKDQIANEKVALQKALLYYESIHGRPVTKNERQVMKPLYDRYRLVKQILSRVNTIPIIGSPSSKRRSPLLQPIIEGETASFFKEIKVKTSSC